MIVDQDLVAAELSSEQFSSISDQDVVASELSFDSLDSMPDSSAESVAVAGASRVAVPVSTAIVIADSSSDSRVVPCRVRKKMERQQRTIKQLRSDLVSAKTQIVELQASRGEKHKRMAPHVGLTMALHRNQGNTGIEAFGRMLDGQRSANTIKMWELAAGNSLVSAMCHFHATMERTASCADVLVSHILKSDATKSGAWRGNKMQALHCRSVYAFDADRFAHEVWTDTLVVTDGSGNGAMNLTRRQLRSVGCPALDTDYLSRTTSSRCIRSIICCGDNGPDQVVLKRRVVMMFKDNLHAWASAFDCFMHQLQLGNSRVLAAADDMCALLGLDFTFYSAFAKLGNLMRSKPTEVGQCAKAMFPDAEIARLQKCIAPKAFAGRWCQVNMAAKKYLSWGEDNVRSVVEVVFVKKSKPEPQAKRHRSTGPGDEDKIQEIQAYHEKLGRWTSAAWACVTEPLFWVVMDMWQAACEPFLHLLLSLQQNTATLLRKHGPRTTTMSLLVTGKAESIFNEYSGVLDDDRWRSKISSCLLQKGIEDGDLVERLHCVVVSLTYTGIVEYAFRILRKTKTWPLQLMFFCHELPTVACPLRKATAAALLDEDVERLDSMSAKVRQCFRREIRQCSQDGCLDPRCWRAIEQWKSEVPSDMQRNESGNSVITHITKTAPGIENMLLSARFTVKQELAQRERCQRMSSQQCLDLCLDHYKGREFEALVSNHFRWSHRHDEPYWMPLPYSDAVLSTLPALDDNDMVQALQDDMVHVCMYVCVCLSVCQSVSQSVSQSVNNKKVPPQAAVVQHDDDDFMRAGVFASTLPPGVSTAALHNSTQYHLEWFRTEFAHHVRACVSYSLFYSQTTVLACKSQTKTIGNSHR